MRGKGNVLRTWVAVAAALLVAALAGGCGLDTRFKEVVRPLSLSFAVTYGDRGSEVVVRYSVPAPRSGKVYVLWAYDQGRRNVAKLGAVDAGVDRTVRGSAPFPIQGVVITEESSPGVARMEGTGVIELTLEDQNLGPTAGNAVGQRTPGPSGRGG